MKGPIPQVQAPGGQGLNPHGHNEMDMRENTVAIHIFHFQLCAEPVLYAVREVGQRACLSSGAWSLSRQGWPGKREISETTFVVVSLRTAGS